MQAQWVDEVRFELCVIGEWFVGLSISALCALAVPCLWFGIAFRLGLGWQQSIVLTGALFALGAIRKYSPFPFLQKWAVWAISGLITGVLLTAGAYVVLMKISIC